MKSSLEGGGRALSDAPWSQFEPKQLVGLFDLLLFFVVVVVVLFVSGGNFGRVSLISLSQSSLPARQSSCAPLLPARLLKSLRPKEFPLPAPHSRRSLGSIMGQRKQSPVRDLGRQAGRTRKPAKSLVGDLWMPLED